MWITHKSLLLKLPLIAGQRSCWSRSLVPSVVWPDPLVCIKLSGLFITLPSVTLGPVLFGVLVVARIGPWPTWLRPTAAKTGIASPPTVDHSTAETRSVSDHGCRLRTRIPEHRHNLHNAHYAQCVEMGIGGTVTAKRSVSGTSGHRHHG